MFPTTLSRSLLGMQRIATNFACIHTHAANFAVVKKTTSAAGGVMGLGKGKKKMGKLGAMEKAELPVETDPERLVTRVCGSNIYVTGEDVQIQADSEYPSWLFSLRTGPPPAAGRDGPRLQAVLAAREGARHAQEQPPARVEALLTTRTYYLGRTTDGIWEEHHRYSTS